ncbi:MAG: NRDE family protein, partial [Ignavibacteriales bacterium]
NGLYYYSNREKLVRRIEPGVHGISNSLLDVPWPKTSSCLTKMSKQLENDRIEEQDLFSMMADREQPSDEDLPSTGVSLDFERMLAPAFVLSPEYGTKSTTVLLVGQDNSVRFKERSFEPSSLTIRHEVDFSFKID